MRYRIKDGAVWRQAEILRYLDMQNCRCMKRSSRAASGCGDVAGPVALVDCNNF
jgi:hypothetical protein